MSSNSEARSNFSEQRLHGQLSNVRTDCETSTDFVHTPPRPFRFLSTEAIVQFGAAYNGFLYGLSFLFNGAFHMIFGPNGYGYSISGVGIAFLGIVVGITIGLVSNMYQERYYQRQVTAAGGRDVPEARVHHAKSAAIVLPLSLLAFAFLATPHIHPILPVLASACWGWSFYTLSK